MTKTIGLITTLLLVVASCANAPTDHTTEAIGIIAARQDDGRTLEEKVDTDGDGEMSDEEIQTYARTVLLDFSTCMRENGYPEFTDVVLEDLTEGSGSGQGRFLALMRERDVDLADPNAIPTLQSCGEDLSDLQTFAPQPSDDEVAEREAAVLEFATCMRDGGVKNWPDPDFANNGGNGYGPELLAEFDLQSSDIQDAITTCRAENSGVTIGQGDEDDEDQGNNNAPDGDTIDEAAESDEPIERSPISPLIEGDTSGLNVATVTRRDLVQTRTLAGTLGYGEQRPFPTNSTGIVTELPVEGDIVEFGEALFHVDNEPVLLLEGGIPQFRPFTVRMSDGPDVEQLERNLTELGFADDYDLTVDDDFTTITRDVIEELQIELGAEDTGRLDLGRVVFSPTPVRISGVHVELGQSINPQINILSITENDQRISLDLDADDRTLVSVGTDVDIELPDGAVVAGEVTDIAAVATRGVSPQNGATSDPSIEVTVMFSSDPPDDVFDAAPVDIIVAEDISEGVLTVPVPALVAMSGGGHAVELIVDGGTQLIEVELGDFVDDIVEVIGDLREGDTVVMATAG
ncbi:MAG: efflux RND transporter periplasmic adaptor subunit [Actinomycetia bacterium]|nr:efflux RND transporter periplasmic adaptor subunit [Actinomycetes bacterium]